MHPEHQIDPKWMAKKTQLQARHKSPEDDDVGAPNRKVDVRNWSSVIVNNYASEPLHAEVRDYFCMLAYRFGFTHQTYSNKKRREFKASPAELAESVAEWEQARERLQKGWRKDVTLADIVRVADPKKYREGMSEQEAHALVGEGLVAEAERSWNPIHPTRIQLRESSDGTTLRVIRRPGSLWSWALPEARGEAPRFFSMDRWPLSLLTDKAAAKVRGEEAGLDPRTLWDPCSEDITPARWHRGKAQPFRDEPVEYKEGPASFPIGDTYFQSKMVENTLTSLVAMGESGPLNDRCACANDTLQRSGLSRPTQNTRRLRERCCGSKKTVSSASSRLTRTADRHCRPSTTVPCPRAGTGPRSSARSSVRSRKSHRKLPEGQRPPRSRMKGH
jgi:hypothetical protein